MKREKRASASVIRFSGFTRSFSSPLVARSPLRETFGEAKRAKREAKDTVGLSQSEKRAKRDRRWNSQSSILSFCSKQRKTREMPA
jgi:hypothetical protein